MRKPKVKMGEVDFVLFATILLLVTIGVVMVYSASSYSSAVNANDAEFFLKKQIMWAGVGCVAMIFALNIDYHIFKRHTGKLMIVTVICLIIVLFCPPIKGARRWIPLGFASLQPSEIAKYTVVFFMAMSMERKGERIKLFGKGVMPYLIVCGFFAGMVLLEKNLSIASVIMIVTVIVLFVSGAEMKHLVGVGTLLIAAGVAFTVFEPYRMARLMNFRNPFEDARGDGYQLVQSFLALGSGGITGTGIGQSRQKCLFIPEPHNDFIFSIVGEELGFIGCLFILILFLIFIWRGIKTAVTAKDMYGTLLATGITCVIAVQAIINVAVVTGSMPVTGVPLPFISYGGSSLVINMASMGVLLNISRQTSNKRI